MDDEDEFEYADEFLEDEEGETQNRHKLAATHSLMVSFKTCIRACRSKQHMLLCVASKRDAARRQLQE
jgi:hypothetical protein